MLIHPLEVSHSTAGRYIIGIDEVGRGALAGPLVVCACLVPVDILLQKYHEAWVDDVTDSKRIAKKKLPNLAERIKEQCLTWILQASSKDIDKAGIGVLNRKLVDEGIESVISSVGTNQCHFLIDHVRASEEAHSYSAFPRADSLCFSVACASIVAKCYRDALMKNYSLAYPDYGWSTNVGYGTRDHIRAIKSHGLTKYHRRSFLKNITCV
ncbi:MAG: Ribonuclease HII [Microgenomates bacterium OLB22]|nr:MAG: Ribonuclease HII [Microgenomates bacterium OLB22]